MRMTECGDEESESDQTPESGFEGVADAVEVGGHDDISEFRATQADSAVTGFSGSPSSCWTVLTRGAEKSGAWI